MIGFPGPSGPAPDRLLKIMSGETNPELQPTSSSSRGRIVSGVRNNTLASLAGGLRSRGQSEVEIATVLLGLNAMICEPPLEEDEVRGIARSIGKYRASRDYRLLTVDEMLAMEPPGWLIEGVLPSDGVSAVCGQYGHFKSFVMLDWALSIATGVEWSGRPVRQRPVVYVAAEGKQGYGPRIQAWLNSKGEGSDTTGLRFIDHAVQLRDDAEIDCLMGKLAELDPPPGLVVVDTLARCFVGGEENSAKDVGVLVEACERIRLAIGGAVVLVHHTGRNGLLRGSTALPGALQAIIRVAKTKPGTARVSCEKMKDGLMFDPMLLQWVEVGSAGLLIPTGEPDVGSNHVLMPNDVRGLEALRSGGLTHTAWEAASGVKEGSFGKMRKRVVDLGLVLKRADRYELTAVGARVLADRDSSRGEAGM